MIRRCLDCRREIEGRGSRCGPCKGRHRGNAWKLIRAQILAYDGHRCRACGAPCPHLIGAGTKGHHPVDHIVPKSRGGTDEPGNLQTLCESCHRDKTSAEARGERAR